MGERKSWVSCESRTRSSDLAQDHPDQMGAITPRESSNFRIEITFHV